MATLFLCFGIIGFSTIPIMVKFDTNYKEKITRNEKHSKVSPLIIWIIAMVLVGSVVIGLPLVQRNIAIGSGEIVSSFDRHDLYYEQESDTYFVVNTNNWNILPVVNRECINKTDALEIIEKSSQFNELKDDLTSFYE